LEIRICFWDNGLAISKAMLVQEKNNPINAKSIIKFENSNRKSYCEWKIRR
jgi:hypothetical protein